MQTIDVTNLLVYLDNPKNQNKKKLEKSQPASCLLKLVKAMPDYASLRHEFRVSTGRRQI